MRDESEHRPHVEFRLMHGARRDDRAEHVDRALMDVSDDLRDIARRETMLVHDSEQSVRSGMRVTASRVILERGFRGRPATAQPIDETRRIGVARHACGHALRAFENVRGALEAVGGELRRHQAVGGGHGRVKLLRVGGIAQELPQPARLRARRAERVEHLSRRQTEQAACRRRGRKRACRALSYETPCSASARGIRRCGYRLHNPRPPRRSSRAPIARLACASASATGNTTVAG